MTPISSAWRLNQINEAQSRQAATALPLRFGALANDAKTLAGDGLSVLASGESVARSKKFAAETRQLQWKPRLFNLNLGRYFSDLAKPYWKR